MVVRVKRYIYTHTMYIHVHVYVYEREREREKERRTYIIFKTLPVGAVCEV